MKYLDVGPSAPTRSIGSAGQEFLAAGAVTREVAAAAQDVALRLKKQKEAGEIATFFANIEEEAANFSNGLMTRQDPENWVSDYRELSRGWQGRINEQKWLPGTKAAVLEQFTGWNARKTTSLAQTSARRVYEEGRARIANTLEYAASRGNRELYNSAVEQGAEAGFFGPAEREKLAMEGERKFQVYEVRDFIETDAAAALDALKADDAASRFDQLGVEDIDRLATQAERELERNRAEQSRGIIDAIDSGRIATKEDLARALEATDLDERQAKDHLENFANSQPIEREERFEITDALNELHDRYQAGEIDVDQYRVEHDKLAQRVYSYGQRDGAGALRSRVYALDPAKWSADGGRRMDETEDSALRREVERIGKTYADEKVFGAVDETAKPMERAKQRREAARLREAIEEKVMQKLRANPKLDPDETFDRVYYDELAPLILGDPMSPTSAMDDAAIPKPTPPDYASPKIDASLLPPKPRN